MQHSNSTNFGTIPIDSNTLAGQWMTFSHMANHYRKLLNVKPRVDTGLINGNGISNTFSIQSSKKKMSSKSSKKPQRQTVSSNNHNILSHTNHLTPPLYHDQNGHCHQPNRKNGFLFSSHPDHLNSLSLGMTANSSSFKEISGKPPLNNKLLPPPSGKHSRTTHHHHNHQKPHRYASDYQVVFGPSSIRSSTDAFMSDETESTMSNDNNKPPSEIQAPIGVTEKIRRFLSHIHQLDFNPTTTPDSLKKSSSSSVKKKVRKVATTSTIPTVKHSLHLTGKKSCSNTTGAPAPASVVSSATANNIDFRLSRHSRCFLPYEPPSPRKSPQLSARSNSRIEEPVKQQKMSMTSPNSSLNRKQANTKVFTTSGQSQGRQRSNCDELSFRSPRLTRNKFTGSGVDIRMNASTTPAEKDLEKRPSALHKIRRRAESVASIGTICGSEELTAEVDDDVYPQMSIADICATLERELISDDELNDFILSNVMNGNLHMTSGGAKKHKKSLENVPTKDYNHNQKPSSKSTPSLIKSTSMASLVPREKGEENVPCLDSNGSKSGPVASNGHHQQQQANGNNKDSSRDSAYGFSSGESRITTRESTPEKKCLNGLLDHNHRSYSKHHHQSLHHRHDRDIDLQKKPCKDGGDKDHQMENSLSSEEVTVYNMMEVDNDFMEDNNNIDQHLHQTIEKDNNHHHHHENSFELKDKSTSVYDLKRQDSSEMYIALLAELTQDIVSKGIYTNKGLKTLFKSYVDVNKQLNQDKLAEMLERLRMDLGIPKDDSLDKIEFGYGSVSTATSTTFFYKPPVLNDGLSTADLITSISAE